MVKPVKRNPSAAIMPDDQILSNKTRINTEDVITNSAKARKITYSLHPKIIEAIEKYARDNFMSKSAVVGQSVRNMLPPEYFE